MGTMCVYMLVENTQLDFLHIDYFFRALYILHALSCLMMILLQLQHKKRPVPPVRRATRRTTMGSARFQKRRAERKDSINSRGDWNEGGESRLLLQLNDYLTTALVEQQLASYYSNKCAAAFLAMHVRWGCAAPTYNDLMRLAAPLENLWRLLLVLRAKTCLASNIGFWGFVLFALCYGS